MKRLVCAVGVLALLVSLSALHVCALDRLIGQIIHRLTLAEEEVQAENWTAAEAHTRQALSDWQSRDFYLHATLHHVNTDAILSGFHQVLAYLEGREHQPAEYAAANAQLITNLQLLIEEETPTLKNIL